MWIFATKSPLLMVRGSGWVITSPPLYWFSRAERGCCHRHVPQRSSYPCSDYSSVVGVPGVLSAFVQQQVSSRRGKCQRRVSAPCFLPCPSQSSLEEDLVTLQVLLRTLENTFTPRHKNFLTKLVTYLLFLLSGQGTLILCSPRSQAAYQNEGDTQVCLMKYVVSSSCGDNLVLTGRHERSEVHIFCLCFSPRRWTSQLSLFLHVNFLFFRIINSEVGPSDPSTNPFPILNANLAMANRICKANAWLA